MIHENIETDSFKEKVDEGRHELLDVRRPDEFYSGHIEGAVNIDFYEPGFQEELGKLDREKSYLVYCRSGNRSEQTMSMMKHLGFKEVYNLAHGIIDWDDEGYDIVN